MTGYQQAALPEPPPVDTVAMIDKQRLIEAADRCFKAGQRAMAEAMVARAGAVKDGECVALQPALARRLGLA
jgi:hypothetical protein